MYQTYRIHSPVSSPCMGYSRALTSKRTTNFFNSILMICQKRSIKQTHTVCTSTARNEKKTTTKKRKPVHFISTWMYNKQVPCFCTAEELLYVHTSCYKRHQETRCPSPTNLIGRKRGLRPSHRFSNLPFWQSCQGCINNFFIKAEQLRDSQYMWLRCWQNMEWTNRHVW